MTKEDIIKLLGIKTLDYAVPQEFFDKMKILFSDKNVTSNFVWSYDTYKGPNSFGYPRPLTATGITMLQEYNKKYVCDYQVYFNVLDFI